MNEELRLQYRYLDLRRPEMARNLRLRSKVANATRVHGRAGFSGSRDADAVQIHAGRRARISGAEPPRAGEVLRAAAVAAAVQTNSHGRAAWKNISSSRAASATRTCAPTGSRSSRRSISRCRFIEREDIYALIEGLLKRIWKTALNMDIPTPFQRVAFDEALNRFGIDKPDTRFGMELVDFTEEFRASTFKVFSGAVANGGVVKALNAKGLAGATQGQIETMTEYAKSFGAKGLALHQGRERRMEIADREIFQRRRKSRADEETGH